jgi:hypothetical protein
LLHQIYAEADDKSDEIYEVRITAAQRPKIQILVQQLGLPVVSVRKAIGHVAL